LFSILSFKKIKTHTSRPPKFTAIFLSKDQEVPQNLN
jgi:hypothetical protein